MTEQLELLNGPPKSPRYPDVPGHARDSDTSRAAAKSVEPTVNKIRALVLDCIRLNWTMHGGATCEEVELATGLSHQTCSARIRELVLKGLVRDSGERRMNKSGRTATVWRAGN